MDEFNGGTATNWSTIRLARDAFTNLVSGLDHQQESNFPNAKQPSPEQSKGPSLNL